MNELPDELPEGWNQRSRGVPRRPGLRGLHAQARKWEIIAYICAGIGLAIFLVSLLYMAWPGIIAGGFLSVMAIGLFVVAQIIHIRANTGK